jgi:hypothetical protein
MPSLVLTLCSRALATVALSEPEDLGESGPFEERSAPRTKADLLREIRQRADRLTGQQEAEQRQIDPWSAQPPQRRGHGR